MRRYLVVGNQTLQQRPPAPRAAGPPEPHRARARSTSLVPAANPHVHAFWTEGEAHAVAARAARRGHRPPRRATGIRATGSVGDANPIDAVTDLLLRAEFDAVIVSTLPPGLSRWIHQDLPRRLERRIALPVRHVITPFGDMRPEGRRELQEASPMIRIADILERKGDQVLTVTADTPVARVAERMRLARVGAFVVSRDGVHVEGLVTERDVVYGLTAQGGAVVDAPVRSIMTHPVLTCEAHDPIDRVLGAAHLAAAPAPTRRRARPPLRVGEHRRPREDVPR